MTDGAAFLLIMAMPASSAGCIAAAIIMLLVSVAEFAIIWILLVQFGRRYRDGLYEGKPAVQGAAFWHWYGRRWEPSRPSFGS